MACVHHNGRNIFKDDSKSSLKMVTISKDDQMISSQKMIDDLNDLPRKKDDFSRSDDMVTISTQKIICHDL